MSVVPGWELQGDAGPSAAGAWPSHGGVGLWFGISAEEIRPALSRSQRKARLFSTLLPRRVNRGLGKHERSLPGALWRSPRCRWGNGEAGSKMGTDFQSPPSESGWSWNWNPGVLF